MKGGWKGGKEGVRVSEEERERGDGWMDGLKEGRGRTYLLPSLLHFFSFSSFALTCLSSPTYSSSIKEE